LLLNEMFLVMKKRVRVSYNAALVLMKKLSFVAPLPPIIYAMNVIMPSFIMWVSKVFLTRSEFK
jgi:hypothetical protein